MVIGLVDLNGSIIANSLAGREVLVPPTVFPGGSAVALSRASPATTRMLQRYESAAGNAETSIRQATAGDQSNGMPLITNCTVAGWP